jgi:hypothetical protein
MLGRITALAGLVIGLATPKLAVACAVCGGGTADNRIEFILTTAFLTFLPLILIGGVVYGLRRRYLQVAQLDVRSELPVPDPSLGYSASQGTSLGG